jgi:molybdopterin-guanine dinucleotide biosynthesis protein A/rhodanese-related sulfurtransferase
MGRDKALLEVGGRALAAVVGDALRAAGADPVLAVGGDGAALAGLGLDAVPDDHPGEGPLGGVLTALRRAPTDLVAVLACDLPGARPGGVAAVVAALAAQPGADVALPVAGGRRALVHAAWRSRVEPALASAFAGGERSLAGALRGVRVVEVAGIDPAEVADVDVPADLDRATLSSVPDADVPEVDVPTLAGALEAGARVVDVRSPEEYVGGHVPGATLLPLDELGARHTELPADEDVYVICQVGARSAAAVTALNRAGYRTINVAGGTTAWVEAGLSVVEGPAPR